MQMTHLQRFQRRKMAFFESHFFGNRLGGSNETKVSGQLLLYNYIKRSSREHNIVSSLMKLISRIEILLSKKSYFVHVITFLVKLLCPVISLQKPSRKYLSLQKKISGQGHQKIQESQPSLYDDPNNFGEEAFHFTKINLPQPRNILHEDL